MTTTSLVSSILALLLAAMPATLGFAEPTNFIREVHFGETPVRVNGWRSHFTFDPPRKHPADSGGPLQSPLAVPESTDASRPAAMFGRMEDQPAAALKLPSLEELKVPRVAGLPGVTLAQAGTPAPQPKAPADCAALEDDLFIDLKEVVKAGCTPSEKQIAKLLDNPVSNLVALWVQFDAVQLRVPQTGDTEVLYKLQVIPTFPLSLGSSDWILVNRVVFPFYSAPINKGFGDFVGLTPTAILSNPSFSGVLADPFARTTGFGDLVYVGLLAPKESTKLGATGGRLIWGVGPTLMVPTASEAVLGTGKVSLGPAAVVAYLGPEWTFGLFPQHWWSVGGNPTRADVAFTNIQYFVSYAPPWDPKAQWRIGLSPNIAIDWKARGDKITVPVGLGIGRMLSIGQLPVQVHIEAEYAVIHPHDRAGSRWDFRFYFIPVIPTFLF